MLKKFRAKGEYLYVGLFVISISAISYNPIQQYIKKTTEPVQTQDTKKEIEDNTLITKNDTSIINKIDGSIKQVDTFISSLGKVAKDTLPSLDNSGKYTHITLDNLYKNKDYHHIFFEYKKADLLIARKLASYISNTYKIQLDTAELIVLNTYKESIHNNLEPLLVLSLIGTESSYRQESVSTVGAIGLTQVYPIYHETKIKQLKKYNLALSSIKGNIKIGSLILKEYIELSNGNIANALQRYNGSLGDRTYKYSNKVFTKMNILEQVAKV